MRYEREYLFRWRRLLRSVKERPVLYTNQIDRRFSIVRMRYVRAHAYELRSCLVSFDARFCINGSPTFRRCFYVGYFHKKAFAYFGHDPARSVGKHSIPSISVLGALSMSCYALISRIALITRDCSAS